MVTLTLNLPVNSFGTELTELAFKREPRAHDLVAHGQVFIITGGNAMPNTGSILRITESCCGLPAKALDNLSVGDVMRLTELFMGFFTEPESTPDAT